MKSICLKVNDIFSLDVGTNKSWFTKKYVNDHKGEVPVYSATKLPHTVGYGHIEDNIAGVKYFNDCLTWNIDGSVGVAHYRSGRFALSEKVIPLIMKPMHRGSLDYVFLKYSLEKKAAEYGFDYSNKAGKNKIADIELEIPCTDQDIPDMGTQKIFALKHEQVECAQYQLVDMIEDLQLSSLSLPSLLGGLNTRSIRLSCQDLFSLEIGTRVYQRDLLNEGVPVYSANVNKVFGYVSQPNIADFDCASLLWGIDGVFDWAHMPPNKIFATTDHCGRLTIKNALLYPKYVYYALKSARHQYGFDRTYRASLRNMRQSVSIDVPVDADGEFDMGIQTAVAKKYCDIEKITNTTIDHLMSLLPDTVRIAFQPEFM